MPIYEYEDAQGNVIEKIIPLWLKDAEVYEKGELLKRRSAPSSVVVPVGHPSPINMDYQVKKAYRKLESEGKLQKRENGFSKKQIRSLWG